MTIQASRSASPAKRPTDFGHRARTWLCHALLAVCLPLFAAAHDPTVIIADDEPSEEETRRYEFAKVRAAYMRNFLRYVKWPKDAFAGSKSPYVICILGDDPLGEILRGKRDKWKLDRPFEVLRLVNADAVRAGGCHIVYLGETARKSQELVVCLLHGQPVLTVSEAENFWDVGGGIRLRLRLREVGYTEDGGVQERIDGQFFVNLDAIYPVDLTVKSRMLALAKKILENGRERSKD